MSKDSNKFDVIAKFDHVTKAFGEVVAVSDASFSIEKGKFVMVVEDITKRKKAENLQEKY